MRLARIKVYIGDDETTLYFPPDRLYLVEGDGMLFETGDDCNGQWPLACTEHCARLEIDRALNNEEYRGC